MRVKIKIKNKLESYKISLIGGLKKRKIPLTNEKNQKNKDEIKKKYIINLDWMIKLITNKISIEDM